MPRFQVKELAEARKLNVTELVALTGKAYSTINRIWNNQVKRVDFETMEAIAAALGVPSTELLVEDEASKKTPGR